ncbi:alpha/beta hydrolase family protein [Cronobacter turicensis]|uniref:alpha/beta hydrolase family protein n=1 Tax=Cronobacter turicensis TaxID=413502 RepID=UPI0024AF9DB6|nr:alpha/beta fold hydrolase [Cronobacter turicensis]MDI7419650.1 alpha/beta fold hydrolase [Cronobacter turicensis]MDI7495647.1 alpha/beta fold hydrolase [Cronobacter turicensis]
MRNAIIITIGLFLALVMIIMWRLTVFDANSLPHSRVIPFTHHEDILEGTLTLPAGVSSPPVVLLIHGDGAQDRWSEGGYLPLVNDLLAKGIAVYSWDKPGVGESRGNWLAQTMRDRSDEATVALKTLKKQPELLQSRFGFLGFSQAGWVVPQAAMQSHADFATIVGGAINWRDQGSYFLKTRLRKAGRSPSQIAQAVHEDTRDFDLRYTPQKVAQFCKGRCNRDDFERRNALADAREDIAQMQVPVMVLMGADDRNVNPGETLAIWAATLPEATPRCIRMIEGATHGLLKSRWYDYQLPSQWPAWTQGLFLLTGQHAYAPGALDAVSAWILHGECVSR